MSTPRDLVTRRIARRARRYPDWDLAPVDVAGLTGVDAALATAIDRAVTRRWLTLRTVLEHALRRQWETIEPRLQAVLLVGAAQLLLLDRVPDHAVINEAVGWAKRSIRPGAGGLVNAVLRRVAGLRVERVAAHDAGRRDELPLPDGRAWRLAEPVFHETPRRRCAEQTSNPESLVAAWAATFGDDRAAALATHGLVPAPTLVTGVDGPSAHLVPHEVPGFYVYRGDHQTLTALLARSPHARVQDPTSAIPVERTATLAPGLIVDACAGKGTKTRQLAQRHPTARIVAADPDPERARRLEAACAGNDRLDVVTTDRLLRERPPADLLVLDVPCSNTGVLARRVEARYRCTPESRASLVRIQRQIVADTISMVGAGGHLLYATCSVETAENEAQVEWITRWHPFRVIDTALHLPQGGPGDPPERYRDGGFLALLERAGD